ncbi:MAG: YggS family pyridoxal phosphate-dependent enzyme [Acidobacteriota bacterium]
MLDSAALRARLADVRERIARAAGRAGRDPASVQLVAISKTFDAEHVLAAAETGQVDFGENKVQEGLQKMERTGAIPLRWHLVGHLQSNKARRAAARFDVIHSVDTLNLAVMLDQAAAAAGRTIELLAQVDLAGEPTKHGAREDDLLAIFDAGRGFRAARLTGLMLLPPAVGDPEEARRYFRALRSVREHLMTRGVDRSMLSKLSMGMSHDFEIAVEEGATLVRVGTAIFGSRTHV